MWVVHSIHLGQSTNQEGKKGTKTYMYIDNQKLFNRRGLIIYFRVKKGIFFKGITQKKLCYRLQNPEKFIQKP